MAIDTANKRMSCISIAVPAIGLAAVADGTVDESDMQSVGMCYAGIDVLVPAPSTGRVGSGRGARRKRI